MLDWLRALFARIGVPMPAALERAPGLQGRPRPGQGAPQPAAEFRHRPEAPSLPPVAGRARNPLGWITSPPGAEGINNPPGTPAPFRPTPRFDDDGPTRYMPYFPAAEPRPGRGFSDR